MPLDSKRGPRSDNFMFRYRPPEAYAFPADDINRRMRFIEKHLSDSEPPDAINVSFPNKRLRSRFGSPEVWRDVSRYPKHIARTPQPIPGSLTRPLVDDPLHPLVDDMFLMFKTGADIMWRRVPVHLHTTLTRFPHFALYSDRPGTIAGYEVVDILKDLPEDVLNTPDLAMYRVMRQMQEEAWMWSAEDISMTEGWNIDRFKNIPMMLHAYQNAPSHTKWFVMIDDDTYVLSSNIARYLSTLDSSKPYYIGSAAQSGGVLFAHGGSGVIFSRGALEKLFGPEANRPLNDLMDEYARKALRVAFGDLMASLLLSEQERIYVNTKPLNAKAAKLNLFRAKEDMFQGETISSTWMNKLLWCYPLGTFHHEKSQELELLWQWEQTRVAISDHTYISYYDFYRDFVLPYISEEISNWSIPGGKVIDTEYLSEQLETFEGSKIWPNATKEDCRLACMQRDDCMSWSFTPGECHVQEKGIVKGAPLGTNNADEPSWVSGFLIDRIRTMRASQVCDPLQKESSERYSDSLSTSEGWYYRILEAQKGDTRRTVI